jgi:hypothetical protein
VIELQQSSNWPLTNSLHSTVLHSIALKSTELAPLIVLLITSRRGPRKEHCSPTSPLVHYRSLLPNSGLRLQSHYLATALHATIYMYIFSLCFMLSCPFCFVSPEFEVVFPIVHSCFSWDSSLDLMLMLWLYVHLGVCDVLFSCSSLFFPLPAFMQSVCCFHGWLCGT